MLRKLDTFQLRGIRQILKIETTWAQKKRGAEMTNKKEEVYERASRILYPRHDRYFFFNESHKRWEYADTNWQDKCKPLSQVYTLYRREQIAAIIRASANVITTQTTNPITAFKEVDNLLLKDFPGKHRDGRMRNNWWIEGIHEY